MVVERSELQLVWPADLFAREAQVLLDGGNDDEDTVGWLLAEAFHGDRGSKLYRQLYPGAPPVLSEKDSFYLEANGYSPTFEDRPTELLLRDLIAKVELLPRYMPKRYYPARVNPQPETAPTPAVVRAAWATEVAQLARTGYLEDAFGSTCGDSRDNPDVEGQRRLAELLAVDARLWPLESWSDDARGVIPTRVEQWWPEELFFGVVEAVHDLVARPRRRQWHAFCEDWDYFDFARTPGQAVYRWRTNGVLARSEFDLRLADAGEEAGLLVRVVRDDREQLVTRVTSIELDRGTREHAVALFRGRATGVPEKRSAILALLGLLEARRDLVKTELLSKDEGALFSVANQFALRHQRADQRADYDEAYLDWLYWWYLATLDLTDRLLARQADGGPASTP